METYRVEITGKTPILFGRFGEDAEVSVTSGHRPVTTGDGGDLPRRVARKSAYMDEDTGELYLPIANLMAALIDAGRAFKIGKKQLSTRSDTIIPGLLEISELVLPFRTKEFEVDSRRVRIPATGGSVMRHRARLDKWSLQFTLDLCDTKTLNAKLARELVDYAGRCVGLCDWRPAKRGVFGRFVVTAWEQI